MIPRFALVRARSLDEAWDAYASAAGDAAWYAGGTELLQVMKMGLASFGTLVDLKPIAALGGIERTGDGAIRIGGAATHREVERSPLVAEVVPALVGLERGVANVRVRNQGTLGGNLAFAEPHSDPATFLLTVDAAVELAGPSGTRQLSISDFVLGPLTTAREPDEILTGVTIPARRSGEGHGYAKIAFFERPAVSVGVRLVTDGGRVSQATVAVGSMTESPTLVPEAATALVGVPLGAGSNGELDEATGRTADAFGSVDAIPDLNGSADYKRHLAAVLLRRATRDAAREASDG